SDKQPPHLRTQAGRFRLINNLLYHQHGTDEPRLCIPNDATLRLKILHDHHDSPIAGHLGIDKTIANISHHFFWPKMTKQIKAYVSSCDACQRNKGSNQKPAGLIQPLPIPQKRWQQVTMDFITQLPITKRKNDAIFVVVDRFSKRVHFEPTTTTATAPDIAKLFFYQIFRQHGLPEVIISDR